MAADRKAIARGALPFMGLSALGLVVRLAYQAQVTGWPGFTFPLGDGIYYDRAAREIAAGAWLQDGAFYQAPLYTYFVGCAYHFTGAGGLRLIHALLGAASCGLLAFFVDRLFQDRRTALIAGGLMAINPTLVFFEGLVAKPAVAIFLFCCVLAALPLGNRSAGPLTLRRAWLLGALSGALALVRENMLLAAPITMLAVVGAVPERSRKLVAGGCFVLGVLCAYTPVAAHNVAASGELRLTGYAFGPNLFIGNGAEANGAYRPLVEGRSDFSVEAIDAQRIAEDDAGREMSPGEVSRYWVGRTVDDIVASPGRWLRLMNLKWWYLWNTFEIPDAADPYAFAEESNVLWLLLLLLPFGTLSALAAGGGCFVIAERLRNTWPLAAYLAVCTLSIWAFFVFARFRTPLIPLLVPLAAYGIARTLDRIRAKRWRQVAVAATAVAVVGALTQLSIIDRDLHRSTTYDNISASVFQYGGDIALSIEMAERAMELDPANARRRENLVMLRARAGAPSGRPSDRQ